MGRKKSKQNELWMTTEEITKPASYPFYAKGNEVLAECQFDLVFSAVLERDRLYQRSAYDASYLKLAKRRGLPLATRDEPLKQAAQELGVDHFQP